MKKDLWKGAKLVRRISQWPLNYTPTNKVDAVKLHQNNGQLVIHTFNISNSAMPCPNIFMNADVRNCYYDAEQNNNTIMKVGPLIIMSAAGAAFSGTNMQDQTNSLNYAHFSSSVKEI
jgi:hypothetical protein